MEVVDKFSIIPFGKKADEEKNFCMYRTTITYSL